MCKIMSKATTNVFPALRAQLGDRWYYVATLTLAEVAHWIRPIDEIHERKDFKTWLQRVVRPERRLEIANYLINQKQRFFNAIVAGIYEGEPEWVPVELGKSVTAGDIELGERESTAYGVVKFSGAEQIFAIDGQHRGEGIREALKMDKALKDEEMVVIFVGHTKTDEGRERTRRLFTTLNKYATPVSKAELIALNDDDTFAIVTRKLIDDYKGLSSAFVPLTPTANLLVTDRTSITSVIALYDVIRTIAVSSGSREAKILETGPPSQNKVTEVYTAAVAFWDSLKAKIPAIKDVCESKPADEKAGEYRTAQGGNALLRPAGLHAFAKAARVIVDRGATIKAAVSSLAKVPTELSEPPWCGILWNASTGTMVLKNHRLAVNLYLHLVGQPLSPRTYALREKYRKAIGDDKAKLPTLN